jgi:hypothetical protein
MKTFQVRCMLTAMHRIALQVVNESPITAILFFFIYIDSISHIYLIASIHFKLSTIHCIK